MDTTLQDRFKAEFEGSKFGVTLLTAVDDGVGIFPGGGMDLISMAQDQLSVTPISNGEDRTLMEDFMAANMTNSLCIEALQDYGRLRRGLDVKINGHEEKRGWRCFVREASGAWSSEVKARVADKAMMHLINWTRGEISRIYWPFRHLALDAESLRNRGGFLVTALAQKEAEHEIRLRSCVRQHLEAFVEISERYWASQAIAV